MNPDDDQDWADALAGRARAGAAPEVAAEAALLRDAMKRWPADVPALQPAAADALIGQARAEGLLEPRRGWCPGCLARWRRWTSSPLRLGAAGLVLASVLGLWVVLPALLTPPPAPDGVLRAPAGAVQLRQADDPAAARARLAAKLAALRLPVQGYERLGRFGLDAQLQPPLTPAQVALLRDEGLALGDDGSLRVEFERKP